jgi:hypothetical protein
MSATNDSGPPLGQAPPPVAPGRMAGFLATLGIDFLIWIAFVFIAIAVWSQSSPVAIVAVGANLGFLAAAVALYNFAYRRGYQKFKQGVTIATSIVFLLSVGCWSTMR